MAGFFLCVAFALFVCVATVSAAFTITKNDDLKFGSIGLGASSGSVIIAPNGTVTATDVYPVLSSSENRHAASFTVSGSSGQTFTVLFPSSVVLYAGEATMTLSDFTSSLTNDTGTCDSTGACTFTVGATLTIAAGQPGGDYSGSFSMNAETSMEFSITVQ